MITTEFAATTSRGARSNGKRQKAENLGSFALFDRGGNPSVFPDCGLGPVSKESASNKDQPEDQRADAKDLLGLAVDHCKTQEQHRAYSQQHSSRQTARDAKRTAQVRLLDTQRDQRYELESQAHAI